MEELIASVRELGVLVPIIVRPLAPGESPDTANRGDGGYELIAGERRWRAAAAARLETIPAMVREVDDRASLELAVVENLQREDLDALEEAMGFSHLLDEYGYTQEQLAERLSKSRPAIANALRLLGLPDAVKALVRGGQVSVGHARALLAVPENERLALAQRIARDGLTVRQIERLATNKRPARLPAGRPAEVAAKSPDVVVAERTLRYKLGAPVAIVASGRGGRIEVRYRDDADLARIVEAIVPEGV